MLKLYSSGLQWTLVVLSGLSAWLLHVGFPQAGNGQFWSLAFFFVTALLVAQIPLSPQWRGMATALVDVLAVLVVGVWSALYVAALARLVSALVEPGNHHSQLPFPLAVEDVAAGTLATYAYGHLLPVLAPFTRPTEAALVAVLGYALVRGAVHATVRWQRFRLRLASAWRWQFARLAWSYGAGALGGVLVRQLYPSSGIPVQGILAFMAFSLLTMYTTRLVGRGQVAYRDTLYGLVQAIEGRVLVQDATALEVAGLAAAIGCKLGLDDEEITTLYLGGLLRDIGMVAVSEPCPGHDSGPALPCRHALAGEDIARQVPHLKSCLPIIRYHHEAAGPAQGAAQEAWPLAARIVGLVDRYVALRRQQDDLAGAGAVLRVLAAQGHDPGLHALLVEAALERERWGSGVFGRHYAFGPDSAGQERKPGASGQHLL
jgi:hypothetical protein